MVWKKTFVTLGMLCLCSSVAWAQSSTRPRPKTPGTGANAPRTAGKTDPASQELNAEKSQSIRNAHEQQQQHRRRLQQSNRLVADPPEGGCPASGNDCCAAGSGPGCSDVDCCNTVCAADPFCCDTAWDSICAGGAAAMCGDLCGGGGTNDDCADRITIGEGDTAYNTAGATTDGLPTGPACVFFGNDIINNDLWYNFVAPPGCTTVTVSTCGSVGDSELAVYEGCDLGNCPPAQAPVACNDDACGLLSQVTFPATEGVCYKIRVGTFSAGGVSSGNLNVTCGEPPSACDSAVNDCCVAGGGPGCTNSNPNCCEAICAADPFCCDVAWDSLCSGAAVADDVNCDCEAPMPCLTSTNDCCAAGVGPGCNQPDCCMAICAADPFCCDVAWDGLCAGAALTNPACVCELPECPPNNNDCCVASPDGTPGCNNTNPDCCGTICVADSFCCAIAWDGLCAMAAVNNDAACDCEVTCPPAENSCFATGGPGCNDPTCCAAVCAIDPFCCQVLWDGICVSEAFADPANCPPPPPPGNDACEAREPVCDGATAFTTLGATTDGPAHPADCLFFGDDQISQDIWYNYTASCTGIAIIQTCGSAFDTELAVYDGIDCPVGDDNLLACNDDACGLQSQVIVDLMAGQFYKIRVGGFGTAQGDGTLSINCIGVCVECPDGAFDEGAFDPNCGLPPPGQSNCCFANGGIGCDTQSCQDAVCAIDPFCCNIAWDGICAAEAQDLCPDICQTSPDPDGGCNATPNGFAPIACGDTSCGTGGAANGTRDTDWYELVLESAQEITWQVTAEFPSVAGIIASPCPQGSFLQFATAGPCMTASVTRCLDAGTWYLFAAPNVFVGVECGAAYVATLTCSGETCDPPSNCCSPHGGLGCDNQECQDLICAADPFCCDVAWDGLCSGAANAQCAVCMGGGGGGSNCCVANGGLGCDCQTCQDIVCAVDAFCCDTAWDAICAGEAASMCGDLCAGGECEPPPGPVTITSANPPDNHLDPLQNVTANLAQTPQGIGAALTPDEGSVQYSPIEVTFSDTPNPEPTPCNVVVECSGPPALPAGPDAPCPTVVSVTQTEGVGATYEIGLSGPIPTRECTTITFLGTVPGENLQYRFLPGDYNLSGTTNTQDLLDLVLALNNFTAAGNPARYDGNRNGVVNTQDLLRCVQLLNGTLTTEVWNQKNVSACP